MLGSICANVLLAVFCCFLIWRDNRLRNRVRDLELTHRKFREDQDESATVEAARDHQRKPGKLETQFLANMSHELRTPLNSMLILSKLLLKNQDGRLTDTQLKWVNTICRSGADLLKLIDEILDFSKIEAQTPKLRLEEVSPRDMSDQLQPLFQCVAAEKELEFSVEIDVGTPETIHTDPHRLQQILRNLVSNAFKFTESGWVKVKFLRPEVDAAPGDAGDSTSDLAISVSDSGTGIAAKNHEVVFQAFRQEESGSTRRYGGTGLGLAISRKLARLLGGDIRLESEPGVGSTFTLYLPSRTPEPVEGPSRSTVTRHREVAT